MRSRDGRSDRHVVADALQLPDGLLLGRHGVALGVGVTAEVDIVRAVGEHVHTAMRMVGSIATIARNGPRRLAMRR